VLKIGNNTTIESAKKAKVARIQNSYIALNQTDNVILRYVVALVVLMILLFWGECGLGVCEEKVG
jgi:hypothetical protein